MTDDPARKTCRAYVEALNARDLEALVALFAAEATLSHPFGVYVGPDALRAFYGEMVLPTDTKLTVEREITDGPLAVIEVSARSPFAPDLPQYAVEVMEVDSQGKITDLRVYYRTFEPG